MTIRQELHSCIDAMPENKLVILKPLLFSMLDESVVIEYNLTDEECSLIAEGMAQYENNPDVFVPLDDIG